MHALMVSIAQAYGVRPTWLIAGEGPMLEGDPDPEVRPDGLMADERRLLRGYRAASPKMKKAFLRFSDYVALTMDPGYEAYIASRRGENEGRE